MLVKVIAKLNAFIFCRRQSDAARGREHPKTASRTPVLFLLSAEPPDCNTERKRAACAMFSLQTLEML